MRLKENLEQAIRDPTDDIHLALRLQRLFKTVKEGRPLSDRVTDTLSEIDELPLEDLFTRLTEWHDENSFTEATEALQQLSGLIEEVRDRGWQSVATALSHERIRIKANLSGHSPQSEIQDIYSHLQTHYEEIHSSVLQTVFELVDRNSDSLSDSDIHDWASLSDDIATYRSEANRFIEQRRYLSYTVKFREQVDGDIESLQQRLVDSYDEEAEVKGKRSSHLRADVLERGLARCVEFLHDEKQEEWKRESVEARLDAVENEMAEISPDEEILEVVAEESQENIERLVKWFESRVDAHRSPTYALYALLCSDGYFPSYEQALNAEHGMVFSQMLETQVTSPEGHAIATNPSLRELDEEQMRVPTSYVQNLMTMNGMLAGALYRLIDRGSLTEFDFYPLLELAPWSTDTQSFLVDSILDLFEGNYIQSFAVALPHFESAIVDTLRERNRSATAFTGEGTQQRTLGGLLDNIQTDIEDEYWAYLKVKYTDPRGPNLRNRWSHGQFRYFQANFQNAAILLIDILKTTIQLHSTPYIAAFGFPFRTISTEQRRREEIDISRYTDSQENVRAYGYTDGVGVIVVEDKEEDQTSFIVVRGGIRQDYAYDESSLSRSEVAEHIQMLQSPAPNLPENIELTWVESDEEVRKHIIDILEAFAERGQQPVSDEQVIEAAERYGISQTETETAVESLVSGRILTKSSDGISLVDDERE